jgi:hypothetical protein
VFSHLGSTNIPFLTYYLKAKYVELMGKDKRYNSSYAYWQVKGWCKKRYETFLNNFRKGFENGMMEGGMDSRKKILKLKCFSPLEILTSLFYLKMFLELFFFSSSFFSIFSLSLSNAPSL